MVGEDRQEVKGNENGSHFNDYSGNKHRLACDISLIFCRLEVKFKGHRDVWKAHLCLEDIT